MSGWMYCGPLVGVVDLHVAVLSSNHAMAPSIGIVSSGPKCSFLSSSHPFIHLFAHPLSFSHSLFHFSSCSFIHLSILPLSHSSTFPLSHSSTHPAFCSSTGPLVHSSSSSETQPTYICRGGKLPKEFGMKSSQRIGTFSC